MSDGTSDQAMSLPSYRVEIAVPVPIPRTYDYLSQAPLTPGQLVGVNFAGRTLVGVALQCQVLDPKTNTSEMTNGYRLKSIDTVFSDATSLPPAILELCRWAANYYLYPLGEVLSVALPSALRKGAPLTKPAIVLQTVDLSEQTLAELNRAPKQRLAYQKLLELGPIDAQEAKFHDLPREVIRNLVRRGLLLEISASIGTPPTPRLRESLPTLTLEQRAALKAVVLDRARTTLVQGVTGSGKTELYLRWMWDVLSVGKQVLVLVPEIALTPQTVARFRARFDAQIAVFHSGLSERQRQDAWLDCKEGRAQIVLGTRSALFVPMRHPGLIIIDEEHDASFKQQEGFRYSARDLAVVRGQLEQLPVILGSATPSLETLHNATSNKYQHVQLLHRAADAAPERYDIWSLPSPHLDRATQSRMYELIKRDLKAGGQVLVMINRRGFAPVLYCTNCQWIAQCRQCDARLTLHQARSRLICHHCSAMSSPPSACPKCSTSSLTPLGEGTQRLESDLGRAFPDFPVIRIDGDSARSRDQLQSLLNRIQSGEACILVGTQLVSKGHHFPHLTLAFLLETDQGLLSSDYRALERTVQLIFQTGGRVGRGAKKGEVKLLTSQPDHPMMRFVQARDYTAFAKWHLAQRTTLELPPIQKFGLIRAESTQPDSASQLLNRLANHLRLALKGKPVNLSTQTSAAQSEKTETRSNESLADCEVFGPIPPLMEKKNRWYRSQLLVSASKLRDRQITLGLAIEWLSANSPRGLRWHIDVDPIDQI